jgi:hypothetical protein
LGWADKRADKLGTATAAPAEKTLCLLEAIYGPISAIPVAIGDPA